ncbi:MAG: hypothetical protein Q8J84_06955 [Flavobacteriaceae bacterium]|nr:hypothetical protein [Flavobacteriaceae bacterium]
MKIAFKIAILVFLLLNVGCKYLDPCGDGVLASTGPPVFPLKLVDALTGENLITNGTYAANQISITDINGKSIEYYFKHENQYNTFLIFPQSTREDIGVKKIFFKINPSIIIELEVNIYEGKSECFTNYFARDYKALNYPYEIKEDVLIIKL